MVSGRTADLARCGVEGALEVDCLAYTLKLAQERGANMSCEVKPVEGLIAARQQNRYLSSLLLLFLSCWYCPTDTCCFCSSVQYRFAWSRLLHANIIGNSSLLILM